MARLVESGHRLQDVRGYTLDQIDVLLHGHARLDRLRRRDDLLIARAAQSPGDGFQQALSALQEPDDGR